MNNTNPTLTLLIVPCLVSEKVTRELGIMFPKHILPPHMGGTSTVYGTLAALPKGQGLGGAQGMGGMLKRRGIGGMRNDTQPRTHQHNRWGKSDKHAKNNDPNDTKNVNHSNNNNNNNDSNSKSTTRRPWQLNLRGGYAYDHGHERCNNGDAHGDDQDQYTNLCMSVSGKPGVLLDDKNSRSNNPAVHDHMEQIVVVEGEREKRDRTNQAPIDVTQSQPPPDT